MITWRRSEIQLGMALPLGQGPRGRPLAPHMPFGRFGRACARCFHRANDADPARFAGGTIGQKLHETMHELTELP